MHGPTELQPDLLERVAPALDGPACSDVEPTAQHHRTTDHRRRDPGRHGHCVGHHTGERALAQLARHETCQERHLFGSAAAQELREQSGPCAGGARPGEPCQLGQDTVDVGHRERGRWRRREVDRSEGAPADPDATLSRFSDQEVDHRLDLVDRQTPEKFRDRVTFGGAARCSCDHGRGGHHVGEQHDVCLAGAPTAA